MTEIDPNRKIEKLSAWLRERRGVLVAFSGGVDSSLLTVVAHDVLGERMLAALGVSPSLASIVHEQAVAIARDFAVPFREVATMEMEDADYVANRGDRCFYCKQELWRRLVPLAQTLGFDTVVDGTIADDMSDHRPGMRAAELARIESPLAACGITKADVRAAARRRGIPIWDAPAAPCLSSRIRAGVPVTIGRLRAVERAEANLRSLGIAGDLRVRDLGDAARVELPPALVGEWSADEPAARIASAVLSAGFARVLFDRRGYRRGSLQYRNDAEVTDITPPEARTSRDTSPLPSA